MPIEESLVSRFEDVARAQAQRDAIRADGQVVTYGALAEHLARVAHALLESGIRIGDRVALLFDREPAAGVAVLGALKSGALVVPLAASYPPHRLREIMADADVAAIVTCRQHGAHARELVGSRVPVIEIDDLPAPPARDWPAVAGSSPAVILYTSGSTGRPKGVFQTHRFHLHKIERVMPVIGRRPGDRIALFTTYAAGQGFSAIMFALLSGATLCPFDVRREGLGHMVDWLARERITIYQSSATLFRSLTRTLVRPPVLPDLRVVRIGGERVRPDDVAEHRRLFPDARFVVNYSSTETGQIVMHEINRDEAFPDGVVPLGRPLAGMTVRILDDDGLDVSPGEVGEIAVQGAHLSAGYWRDAEQTAREFRALPDLPDHVIYRTGDLGRLRPDGVLEHLGRKDLRVKIRGFRIEIEEIETLLNRDEDVAAAAVAAKTDGNDDLRLVAYVQRVPGSNPTVEHVRTRLAIRLPEHMIPSVFVFLDALPLTDSGKIARRLLPEPPPDRPSLSSACVLPRSAVEAAIAAVWRDVLGLDTVGVHDAFLSIGGDSLKATLVASRLATRVGVVLPLSTLFEAQTIAELAALVERQFVVPGT